MKRKDSIWIGIAIGTLIPLGFILAVTFLVRYLPLEEHTQSFLYILGIGINAVVMQRELKAGRPKIGTGVLLVSFIYAFIFFYYKFRLSTL